MGKLICPLKKAEYLIQPFLLFEIKS